MNDYLLYHSKVHTSRLPSGITVYHDHPRNNQDPYVWNTQFLHTYCHMNQLRKMEPVTHEGDIRFWVSGGKNEIRENFTMLLCDLVFVVKDLHTWECPNYIKDTDPLVDSPEAYEDHYQWPERGEHRYTEKELRYGPRFTLKAEPSRSFQPLDKNQQRLNILDFLREQGVDEKALRKEVTFTPRSSRPFPLDSTIARSLYDWIRQNAYSMRTGEELQKLRKHYYELLSSDRPTRRRSSNRS